MASVLCSELIGRQEELAALRSLLLDPAGGAMGVVGEAGVGKTRLVDELAAAATRVGWRVLRGRASAEERSPYRPIQEVLLAAGRDADVLELPELIPFRSALGRLVPQWRSEADATVNSSIVVAEGVLRVLDAVSHGSGPGVLVVLEDLHWADRESLAVLEHLADHATTTRLRVVATLRPEPGAGQGTVAALAARRALRLVEIAPLADDDVARMARSCLATDELPAGLLDILARADALPFLVEELLGGGAVDMIDGRWTLPAHAPWVMPRSLADAVAWKVASLPLPDRLVPRAAAVLSCDIDPGLLAMLLDRPAIDVEEVLDRCVESQLTVRDGASGYRFRHALTRDAVLAQLGPASRAALAERALSLVRELHPDLPGHWCRVAADLSHTAGDDVEAARLMLEAGRRALSDGTLTTADEVLTAASRLCGTTPGLREELGVLLVDVAAQAGNVDAALTRGRDLLTSCTEQIPCARVALRMAEAATAAGRWDEAFDGLDRAGALTTDAAVVARRDAVTAQALIGTGRVPEARVAAERALRSSDALGAGDAACLALQVLGRIARNEDLDRADQLFTRQLRVAETHGLPLWQITAGHELGTLDLMRRNDVDRLCQARDRAARAGAVSTVATIDLQLAGSAYLSWDTEAGLAASRRCQDTARLTGLGLPLSEAFLAEAAAHAIAGDRIAMETAIDRAEECGPLGPELEAAVHARHGLFFLLRDDRAAALEAFDAAVAASRRAPSPYLRFFWHHRALLRSLDGDPEQGTAAATEVRQRTPPGSIGDALLSYAEAVAAGRGGHRAAAETLIGPARQQLDHPGCRAQRSLADRLVAEAALADGWGAPVEWLTEAGGFFHATGRAPLERACRSLLRRAGAPLVLRNAGHRTTPADLAAKGVTDREADVLALVADGLTSAEIAQRLFISPRTVDKHVERLLAKTGLARRAHLRRLRTQ